jgi:putative transposase
MREFSLFGSLGQASGNEVGEVFRCFNRNHVRSLICGVMAEEVAMLCGPKQQPAGGEYFRSGSSPGRIRIGGQRESLIRPRVRCRTSGGTTEEVSLSTYEGASNPGQLEASILAVLKAGVSSREVAYIAGDSHGTSRASDSVFGRVVATDQNQGIDLASIHVLLHRGTSRDSHVLLGD